MKKYIYIIMLISVSCKAQYSLQNHDSAGDLPSGSYCADIFNDFNNYVGTWKAVQGNKELTFVLIKKTYVYYPFKDIYTDFLTGEYIYKEGNQTLIDTTPNFTSTDVRGNNINGNLFIKDNDYFPICDDCFPNERRIHLYFKDPTRTHVHAEIVLRHKVVNGVQLIKATLYETLSITEEGDNLPEHITVPVGEYTLIKQ
ncbi:DUF6705 family protein [Flavobacterium ponti]|uniref:DUF6705 family protein n=1 Tax=Flavobacterium ponti TaxID=665133 RepID=A0ABV9P2G4_9FLAO